MDPCKVVISREGDIDTLSPAARVDWPRGMLKPHRVPLGSITCRTLSPENLVIMKQLAVAERYRGRWRRKHVIDLERLKNLIEGEAWAESDVSFFRGD